MRQEGLRPKIPNSENFRQEFPGFEGDAQESLGWFIPPVLVTIEQVFWDLSKAQQQLAIEENIPVLEFTGPPQKREKRVPEPEKVTVAA